MESQIGLKRQLQANVHRLPYELALIESGTAKKGDVLGIARIAGIMAAKKPAT